jgi:hypothetical protein
MAIGLGLLFGLSLPVNFLSPYKSKSIIEFWRKWHITLSQFLKDYLYIPLGGNRKGTIRRYTNLMITMVLGGLWHGAGWTFVLWGALHGTYLVVNHLWGEFISPKYKTLKTYNAISWLLTLLAVSVAWVFFRCENVSGALEIVSSMFWYNGEETEGYKNASSFTDVWYWIIIGYMVVLFSPNAQEIISSFMHKKPKQWYSFYISWRWMVITIGTLLTSLFFIVYKVNRISEFIYFQF